MSNLNNIKIGNSNPDAILFNSAQDIRKDSVFDWFKYANDAGGYWVRGLWLAPTSPWGVYSWPWDLNIPNGALKDVNNGWARWGYVRDGANKNITSSMTKNFAENVSGNYGVAITVWFNTPNYTDEDGKTFLDISDAPIVITFKDDRFDDYTWVMKAGAIAEWSEDKRTITIKRIPFDSHIVCTSNNSDKTIAKVREDLYNVYADVTGLSVNDGIVCTNPSSVECWDVYTGDTQVYHRDKTIDNCWKKYGYVTDKTIEDETVHIVKNSDSEGINIVPKLSDYSFLNRCKLNFSPANLDVWDDIRSWFATNQLDDLVIMDGTMLKDAKGFSELTLNLNNKDTYWFGEDNFANTDIVDFTMNVNYSISSPQRWFRNMTKLKNIKWTSENTDCLFTATSVVDMFGGCEELEEYPSNMICWDKNRNYVSGSSNQVTLTQYFVNSCLKLKKIPSYSADDNIYCSYLERMFNNCKQLTTIEPILDIREQMCKPSGANEVFNNCTSLTSVKLRGLNHGSWYFDGQTINGIKHGDLSNLDEVSVKYLFDNLADLTRWNPLINTPHWYNSFHANDDTKWTLSDKVQTYQVPPNELVIPNNTLFDGSILASMEGDATPHDVTIRCTGLDGGHEIQITVDSSATTTLSASNSKVVIPAGATKIELVMGTTNTMAVTPTSYIYISPKWDSTNPLVNQASLFCPASWADKVTSTMVSAANNKGWDIYIDNTLQ